MQVIILRLIRKNKIGHDNYSRFTAYPEIDIPIQRTGFIHEGFQHYVSVRFKEFAVSSLFHLIG